MKKYISAILLLLAVAATSYGQKVPYNVVFDVTSSDTVVHQMVMRWVREIANSVPDAKVEVVFYAKSLDMITKNKSTVADSVMKYASMKNIQFRACEMALKNNKIEKGQLLNGVGTVPDGIYEIISRRHEGWGYIKAAR